MAIIKMLFSLKNINSKNMLHMQHIKAYILLLSTFIECTFAGCHKCAKNNCTLNNNVFSLFLNLISHLHPNQSVIITFKYKKHLKNVGPIRHSEPFYIVIHQGSLLPPLSNAACASMSTTTTTTTTTRDREDRYGPMEWAQSYTVNIKYM